MFVQIRRITVTEGNADKVVERFSSPGIVDEQEGFVDSQVFVKKASRGEEEVVVMIRWESEDHWKQWEKSDAHIAGHKANRGKPKPDYIVNTEVGMYELKAVKSASK
ncbi:antibiotic biosynthesis monooxygenase [Paenibacillus sp. CAA11]|uniref:antibiotic biosynthesis monooxygenase family protein n=1 Tax=Paenibacillus sp. CAA11 TaxID=1532905 RepID=UPI000D3C7529|nr:antibiotic biosynthesis monooxygenase [Paenibacillus sp. CAA11]AWB45223.1 antibiotic biosynthesis monooxygenase [Paenibacillus sp. CAA11]